MIKRQNPCDCKRYTVLWIVCVGLKTSEMLFCPLWYYHASIVITTELEINLGILEYYSLEFQSYPLHSLHHHVLEQDCYILWS